MNRKNSSSASGFILFFTLYSSLFILLTGCGMQVKETFTLNPNLSGKCLVEAKMVVDTSLNDAKISLKDSLYGIETPYPNYHKIKFNRRDAMAFALKFIHTKGVEVWYNIHYGMSKKRDQIYFKGTAYFRDISHLHFTAFDSMIAVQKNDNGLVTIRVNGKASNAATTMLSDDELDKKADEYHQNALYIRPVLADLLNPTEESVTYNLPSDIETSSIFGQEGERTIQLAITGNDILKYSDSIVKSPGLEKRHYKVTGGTNKGAILDIFNSMVFGADEPIQASFRKGGTDLFDYNSEVQTSIVYFDDFMQHSGLEKYDSSQMLKEERHALLTTDGNGELVVSKSDSDGGKPFFRYLTVTRSADTLVFTGEFSQGIKTTAEAKVHILKVVAGQDMDITDSIQARKNITAELTSATDNSGAKVSKRKVKFTLVIHFPPGCNEIAVQGRITAGSSQKDAIPVGFKLKKINTKL
jgi:hypothetical protein